MSEDVTAVLVRHGATAWNRQDRVLGHVAGMDLPGAFREHAQDNCALSELRVCPDPARAGSDAGATLVRENELPWRDDA